MELIHADSNRKEIRKIPLVISTDMQVSISPKAVLDDNSWEIILDDATWELEPRTDTKSPIEKGHYIYFDGTEWGGRVKRLRHSTALGEMTLSGVTWRGMLMQKVIEPPEGEAYLVVSGEANAVIKQLIGTTFGDLIQVSTKNTGVQVAGEFRNIQLHTGIQKMLSAYGMALSIYYSSAEGKVIVEARKIVDHSETTEISQDYNIALISEQGRIDDYNHLIALGAGELVDRDVVHVYRLDNGTLTTDAPSWVGTIKDIVAVYDYSSAESKEELVEGAKKRLLELAPAEGITVDPQDAGLDLPIGDVIGARDRLTNMQAKATITQKILTLHEDGYRIDAKVE